MKAVIRAIEYHLPVETLTNEDLAVQFPEWDADKIYQKLGIRQRHIAAKDETASDLGVIAAQKIFDSGICAPEDVDYLLFCTQSPDYFLPTTACVMQQRLHLPTSIGALDINLGCSGFVYGLGVAKGLIETGQANQVLLVVAETYSKYLDDNDKSTRTVFGDAAAATLIAAQENGDHPDWLGPFEWGTDGSGADHLIVKNGGMRTPQGEGQSDYLFMNGPEIFSFTLRVVEPAVQAVLAKAGISKDDVDLFVFHQANQYMLNHLRKKLKIPPERFFISMEHCGNTVSATVPIALKNAEQSGVLKHDQTVMIVGFGVGLSWAAGLLRWHQP